MSCCDASFKALSIRARQRLFLQRVYKGSYDKGSMRTLIEADKSLKSPAIHPRLGVWTLGEESVPRDLGPG